MDSYEANTKPMDIEGTGSMERRSGAFSIQLASLNIECAVYNARKAREGATSGKHYFHKHDDGNHARISKPNWCDACGRIVDWGEIINGYEVEKGKYAFFNKAELEALNESFESKTLRLMGSTKVVAMFPEYIDDTFVLSPLKQKRKGDEAKNDKLYSLLADSLARNGTYLIGKVFTSRGTEIFAAITAKPVSGAPVLYMYSLLYAYEVKNPVSLGITAPPSNVREKEMMDKLVESQGNDVDYSTVTSELKEIFQKAVSDKMAGITPALSPSTTVPTADSAEDALAKALGMTGQTAFEAPKTSEAQTIKDMDKDGMTPQEIADDLVEAGYSPEYAWKKVKRALNIAGPLDTHYDAPKKKWEVLVGNVGTVYEGGNKSEAQKVYDEYVKISKIGHGRAGDEDVSLFQDGEPIKEHFGDTEKHSDDAKGDDYSAPKFPKKTSSLVNHRPQLASKLPPAPTRCPHCKKDVSPDIEDGGSEMSSGPVRFYYCPECGELIEQVDIDYRDIKYDAPRLPKKAIVVGAVALAAVVGFLYFRAKNKTAAK